MFWTRAATLYHVSRTPQVNLTHNHRVGRGTRDATAPDVVVGKRSGDIDSCNKGDVPIPKKRDPISLQEIGCGSAEADRKVRDRNHYVIDALPPLTTVAPVGCHGPELVSSVGSRRKKLATSSSYRQHSGYIHQIF